MVLWNRPQVVWWMWIETRDQEDMSCFVAKTISWMDKFFSHLYLL